MSDPFARQRQLVAQFPGNELARFSLGKALFDAGLHAEARVELEHCLARKPDWMVAHILAGKCALALGDRIGARTAFERARQLALEQNHEGPLEEMTRLLAELG